jgi:spermidine/putrescine-binding protein
MDECDNNVPVINNGVREPQDGNVQASLLDFCIPYVLQSILFAYKGDYMDTKPTQDVPVPPISG